MRPLEASGGPPGYCVVKSRVDEVGEVVLELRHGERVVVRRPKELACFLRTAEKVLLCPEKAADARPEHVTRFHSRAEPFGKARDECIEVVSLVGGNQSTKRRVHA